MKCCNEVYNYPIMKIDYTIPLSLYKYRHPKSHTIKSHKDIWYIQSTYRRKNEIRFKRDEDEDIYLTPRQRNAKNRLYKNSQCGNQHNVGVSWKRHTKNRKAWAKHKGKLIMKNLLKWYGKMS